MLSATKATIPVTTLTAAQLKGATVVYVCYSSDGPMSKSFYALGSIVIPVAGMLI